MARRSPWPTVLGTAALLALPVLAAAQSGQASTTGSQTPQEPKAQSDTRYPVGSGAATHHLTEAKQVLDGISRNAVTGPNASKLNQVRREFAALQRSYSANPSTTPGAKSSHGTKAHWNTQLMALDRDLTALLGPSSESTSSATATSGSTSGTETETAGTSGTNPSRPSAGNVSSDSSSLDPNVRSQLEEFRKHITEFAAAASGTEPAGDMSSSSAAGAASSMGTGSSTSSTSSMGTSGSSSSSSTPTEPTAQSSTSGSQSTPPTSSSSQTGSATGEATQAQSGEQVDAAAARQHLTEARQSLADLTALPQAQQLQGEARNQVSQLISQFNQLITTQDDWRSAYEQVNGTLTTLLAGSSASSPSSASESAVGTSGSANASAPATLDPAIRTKLEEFRTHLQAFHSAAGGDAAASSSSAGSTGSTAGSSSSMSSSTGTTSSTGSTAGDTGSAAGASSSEAESHIDAIERILDQASGSSSSATGTSGTAGSASGSSTAGSASGTTSGTSATPGTSASSVTLTQQQIDQIRLHLQQLRTSIKK